MTLSGGAINARSTAVATATISRVSAVGGGGGVRQIHSFVETRHEKRR